VDAGFICIEDAGFMVFKMLCNAKDVDDLFELWMLISWH